MTSNMITDISLLQVIAISLMITLVANSIFVVFGFYNIPKNKKIKEVTLSILLVCKAFIVFLVAPLIIVPAITSLWFSWNHWDFSQKLSNYTETWLHLFSVGLTLILFSLFLFLLDSSTRKTIFGQSKSFVKDFFIGCATWLVAYPAVSLMANSMAYIIMQWYGEKIVEQVAVEKMRLALEHPIQSQMMTVTVALIVPFLEEVLFRGIFQTWIRQRLGITLAIISTSVIFSFFHFSSLQGATNLQLVATLFILSCYLGYLRERQSSIYAPIGLHITFNGISVLVLQFSS